MSKPGYVIQADVIRIVAIVGVVLIHLMYPIYARPDYLGGMTWWMANAINSLVHTAVPLFIMLSGYLLLPKKETGSLTKRIVRRLVFPALAWYGIYLYWNITHNNHQIELAGALAGIFKSNMYHMYFLVILTGLYALIPLIQSYILPNVRRLNKAIIYSSLIGMLIFIAPYFITPNETQYNSLTIWIPFLCYFLLGYWYSKFSPTRWKLLVIFVVSYLTTVALGYLNVYLRGQDMLMFWSSSNISYFDEYLSPNMFFMSISLFPLLLHSKFIGSWANSKLLTKLIAVLSSAAFAVYILHSIVIDIIDLDYGFSMTLWTGPLMPYFMYRVTLITIVSFIVGAIAVRVPYFQMLFGVWPKDKNTK